MAAVSIQIRGIPFQIYEIDKNNHKVTLDSKSPMCYTFSVYPDKLSEQDLKLQRLSVKCLIWNEGGEVWFDYEIALACYMSQIRKIRDATQEVFSTGGIDRSRPKE